MYITNINDLLYDTKMLFLEPLLLHVIEYHKNYYSHSKMISFRVKCKGTAISGHLRTFIHCLVGTKQCLNHGAWTDLSHLTFFAEFTNALS